MSSPMELVADLGMESSAVDTVSDRMVKILSMETCGNATWAINNVVAVWDEPGTYTGGVAVSTGLQLQEALQDNPLTNISQIYLVQDIMMVEDEWPLWTNVTRPVLVTGCPGVVWDVNMLGQKIFVWKGGNMVVDGRGNMTIANSRPTPRRGNVWMLVGAWSVETGIITIQVNYMPWCFCLTRST